MPRELTRSTVELIKVYPDQFDDEANSAHVKQTVSVTVDYARSDFLKKSREYSSDRYCFVAVPREWDEAEVKEQVEKGQVQRIIGCIPQSVMSEGQLARYLSLTGDEKTAFLDAFENKTRVVGSEGEELFHNGYAMFARNQFKLDTELPSLIDVRNDDIATLALHDESATEDSPFMEEQTREVVAD